MKPKLIKIIDKPNTKKYRSVKSEWGEYECPYCNKIFNAPVLLIDKANIKSCGCLKAKIGTSSLKKYWANNKNHPNGVYITLNDETYNITQWSEKTGIPRSTIRFRHNRNYKPEEILKEYYQSNEYRYKQS